jgi:two-component system, NtrC family, sensor kinase
MKKGPPPRIEKQTSNLPNTEALLELAHLPVALTEGRSHSVRYVNPAFCTLLGKGQEELIGRDLIEILPDGNECLVLLDRVYRTREPASRAAHDQSGYRSYDIWSVLAQGNHPSGIVIQVRETTAAQPQAIAMNEALLVSAVRQHEAIEAAETLNAKLELEMQQRKDAETALLRSEKLASMGRMAASIAHEINNPLSAVMNLLFLARNTPDLPQSTHDYLETANGELMRIAHITRQTLGFYHHDAVPTRSSASALLDSVVDLLRARVIAKKTTVTTECPEGLQVLGIFDELRQVLANLLLNSLDAVEQNGTVRLRASASSCTFEGRPCLRVTVADSGKGIPKAAIKQIYEPLFTTKGSIGTGLGLWVAKQLIEKHGGAIRVHSAIDGNRRGTTFSIMLPLEARTPVSPKN